jgi:hypothetical protein
MTGNGESKPERIWGGYNIEIKDQAAETTGTFDIFAGSAHCHVLLAVV